MMYMPPLEQRPRAAWGPSANWVELAGELDRWGEAGRVAPLWWRDDDAVAATPELSNLLHIAGGAPVALAVIPAHARPELAAVTEYNPSIAVLQHGWRHGNRAVVGRKSEYPGERPRSAVAAEIVAGRERLVELLGNRALPIFVPPWNRIAPELLPVLAEAGFRAVSTTEASRPARLPARLASIDVHVDLTDWRRGRVFVGTAAALGALVARLRALRLGTAAPAGPVGILTHHLVMDTETARFLESLCALVGGHAAARWIDIAELLR